MLNFKIILLILLAAASAVSSLVIHNHANADLRARAEILRQQSQQFADLQAEQRRLSNQLAAVATPAQSDYSAEIAKLRAETEALRKQTNELAKQLKPRLASQPLQPASKPQTYTPEYREQMNQLVGTKSIEARDIACALIEYAQDHNSQYPSSLDQITPYLTKENRVLSGTNQFEIVYQGSLDQLDGIPLSFVAAVRDTQTFLTPDGKPARVYGMIPGIGQTVTSDDNFQSWEAEHVISSPASSTH